MLGSLLQTRKPNMGQKSANHLGALEIVVHICGKDPVAQPLKSAGTVQIGRDCNNDIAIEDSSVSRHHAVLHIGSDLRIEDKSSRNGTEVYKPGRDSGTDTTIAHHPERSRSFHVEIGDRIKLGSVILVIRKALFESAKGTSGLRLWAAGPTISDPLMAALYDDVREVARSSTRAPILIYGETGAGKENVARTIHDVSKRSSRAFVAVNCKEFTDALVGSKLFGHKKGAFTGATSDQKGYFDTAHTGTLFLDEIGELSLETQAALLRVLDYGEVCPIGDTLPHYVNVRVVAATNRDLYNCVRRGLFREDLYYRLKGFEFEVPPLRKRPKDIQPLAERFLADACRRDNQPYTQRFSEAALACLHNYRFPGNVRELKYAVEVASVHCHNAIILPEHLPPAISRASVLPPEPESTPQTAIPLHQDDKRARIRKALDENGGNQKQAAISLGISNRTLVNWLNDCPDIRRPKKKFDEQQPFKELPPSTPSSPNGHHAYDRWPNGDF
jgi:DNA-binding NtrC family response regulator